MNLVNQILYSFIHYKDLFSTSSRLLLRGAPCPSMAKRNSLGLGYNASEWIKGNKRSAKGSLFHTFGQTTKKAGDKEKGAMTSGINSW